MKRTRNIISLARIGVIAAACCASAIAQAQVAPADAQTLAAAQQALSSNDPQQAATLAQQFVNNQPNEGDGWRVLAAAQHQLGNNAAARESAVKAITLGRLTDDMLTRIMQIDMQQNRHASVAAAASLLSMIEPDNTTWQLVRGQALLENKEYEAASQAFQAIADSQPSNANTWAHLGNASLKLNNLTAAAAHYETAWHLGNNDPALPVTLTRIYLSMDDPEQAENWHARARQLDIDIKSAVTLNLAQALVRSKNYSRAKPLLDQLSDGGTSTNPDEDAATINARAMVLLATIAADEGDIPKAVAHLEAAAKVDSIDPTPLRFIANYYLKQNDLKSAAAYLARAADAGANDAQTLAQLIGLYIQLGNAAQARARLIEYIEGHSLDSQAGGLITKLAAQQ